MNCTHCTIVLTNKDMRSERDDRHVRHECAGEAEHHRARPAASTRALRSSRIVAQTDSNGASSPNKINGGGSQVITGALYFPSQAIDYNGNGTATAICTQFVARRVTFTGNSATSNKFQKGSDCPFYADDPIGGGRRVRLVA